MFYIVKDNICIGITQTVKATSEWLRENNKTIYQIYPDEFKNVVLEVK